MIEEFYIEDYIWLIVVGVFVFLVIVGFVADKTGLARKTFGKMPNSVPKKKKSESVESLAPVEEPVIEKDSTDTSDVKLPVMDSMPETPEITQDMPSDNLYLNEDDIYGNPDEIQSSSQNEEDNLYLNDESSQNPAEDQSLENSLGLDENTTDNDSGLNNEEDLYQPIGDVSFKDIKEDEEDASIEDVWQLDDSANDEDENNLELPSLDEINSDTDEDVWKF